MTGAEAVIKALQDEGVEIVFGYPGGAVLHIYDALYKQDKVNHILVRHEQGATHAADGYARATGKVGVVLVTSGPGVTNAITGIATANMDSAPMVILCGQVPTALIGDDAFQEVDAMGISRPCLKHNIQIRSADSIVEKIRIAFHIAQTGRPGPVLIDIPKDITAARVNYRFPKRVKLRSYSPTVKGHPNQIQKAAQLLLKAKRPMIYAGGGSIIGRAPEKLTQLTRLLQFPCTNTLMGLGSYPATDPLFVGMLGMHGTYEANLGMHGCDVLLSVGARFDDRVTGDLEKFCPNARVIHIDIDPASIGKNVAVEIPIVGDSGSILTDLIAAIQSSELKVNQIALKAWWNQINEWRKADCLHYEMSDKLIKPQYVVQQLYQYSGGDAYITSDVGQHQMFAAQFYPFDLPRRWINSGGLGTMGFGLPAAMGVQLAFPDATVACITGEASIIMCIQELSTCKQYDLPLKIVSLNNRYMGMVRQWQEFFYDRRYAHSYMDALPDFVKLAQSFGHVGIRIEHPQDVEPVLKEALADRKRLYFMDFVTDQTENVYPMIAAGSGHHEMLLNPAAGQKAMVRDLA